jgi:hypothetical protein
VPRAYRDFCRGALQRVYESGPHDPAAVPTPRFDLIADQALYPLEFEATRGCPFACEFCVLSGLGTRFHTRSVESVVRDIRAGQAMLQGRVPRYKQGIVGFCDNNLGGNLSYLRALCAALEPLRIKWYAAVTFNVASNPELVRMMARAGCRTLYVGLESFNPATIDDMGKRQNRVHKTRDAIVNCRANGIVLLSGMLVSPTTDDLDYVRAIPRYLRDCTMHLPAFLSFETPIPGTPYFHRLARAPEPVLLPDVLLRDLNGYTLVARPRHAGIDDFVRAYRETVAEVYATGTRLRKLAADVPRFLLGGHWFTALVSAGDVVISDGRPAPGRTFIAGSDLAPPERVPLGDADFDSEEEYRRIMEPTPVTDHKGRVLDAWLSSAAPWGEPVALRARPRAAHAAAPLTPQAV